MSQSLLRNHKFKIQKLFKIAAPTTVGWEFHSADERGRRSDYSRIMGCKKYCEAVMVSMPHNSWQEEGFAGCATANVRNLSTAASRRRARGARLFFLCKFTAAPSLRGTEVAYLRIKSQQLNLFSNPGSITIHA